MTFIAFSRRTAVGNKVPHVIYKVCAEKVFAQGSCSSLIGLTLEARKGVLQDTNSSCTLFLNVVLVFNNLCRTQLMYPPKVKNRAEHMTIQLVPRVNY
jgi:hypothetical protein